MRKIFLMAAAAVLAVPSMAQNFSNGRWNVVLDKEAGQITLTHDGTTVMAGVEAKADCGGTLLESHDARTVTAQETGVTDIFGTGKRLDITYTMDGGLKMIQTVTLYDDREYLTTQLALTRGDGTEVKSGRLVPMSATQETAPMSSDGKNRMIFVPWDNDGFISYESNALNKEMYSYAVTALYNTGSRYGIVAGAVDHDTWKSAIHVDAADKYKVRRMELISGYTDEHSHDSILYEGRMMPHGSVVADTVRSSRFIVGCFDDWRNGMETFGEACAIVAPRREWAGGVPYGWSSWGVMQTLISYDGIIDCGDFIRDNLMPRGFHDASGKVVLSLDAWWNDNLSDTQVKNFVAYCKANNMIPGLYYGPFCDFGGNAEAYVPGTNNKYKYKDVWLKQNGYYKKIDGAYCMDPTHPGTKMFMMRDIKRFRDWGVEYIKCDFMSNGAIEADSWYNKKCYTGVQAYNEGMAFMLGKAGDNMYIDLSIAPIFPYHYAHGRRISCDAWGTIGHTKYVMNNTSYGWWLNKLYFANDPDHLVMKMRDGGGRESDGVNRARLTSGAITGAYLTGDNFSDNVAAGFPDKSRESALKLLTNEDVNEIPRTCGSFRPLYGNANVGSNAETLLSYENDAYVYLAVFSYTLLKPTMGTMTFADLGVDEANVAAIKELWTGERVTPSGGGFTYNCPYYDARIYRISKKSASGIVDATTGGIAVKGDMIESSGAEIRSVDVYDMAGKCVGHAACRSHSARIPVSGKGVFVVKVTTDNAVQIMKISK